MMGWRKGLGCVMLTICLLAPVGCSLIHASAKVAFLGDSITEGWAYPAVNYGVHGNTTAQMMARFGRLIPGHGYTTVVILGGTNDTLQGVAPEVTIEHLNALGDEAMKVGAEPVLCEIPPIFHSYVETDHTDYGPRVTELNRRIVALAEARHWRLVDYYTPLAGHPRYSSDGVHMKRSGYLLMEHALLAQMPR